MDNDNRLGAHTSDALTLRFDPWRWALPLAALLGMAVVQGLHANTALFLWVNRLSLYTGPELWAVVTLFGNGSLALALVLPFVGRRADVVLAVGLAALLAMVWVTVLKEALHLPRPPGVLPRNQFIIIGPPYTNDSFPSGHSTTAFTLAGVLVLLLPGRRLRGLLIALAALVAVSRLAVGVHWPQDILAGCFGGWLSAVAGVWLARRWRWGQGRWVQLVLGLLLVATALWLLYPHPVEYGPDRIVFRVVSVVMLAASVPGFRRLLRPSPAGGP